MQEIEVVENMLCRLRSFSFITPSEQKAWQKVSELAQQTTNKQSGPCVSCIGYIKSKGFNFCKRCGCELPDE
jgi:hypothetical protein